MQKIADADYAAAFRLLEAALPDDFTLGTQHLEGSPRSIQIRAPSLEPLPAWLAASAEEPAPANAITIVVLQGGGKRIHDRLRHAGLSFVDLSGVVHIRIPGLYIDRTDLTPVRLNASPSTRVDPYSDRASRVVRTLLMKPRARRWTTSGVAAAAEVDVSTASRVVRELRRRDLVLDEAPGQGRSSGSV